MELWMVVSIILTILVFILVLGVTEGWIGLAKPFVGGLLLKEPVERVLKWMR